MSSDFFCQWEQERNAGFLKYYIRHLPSMLFIFAGVSLVDYFANEKVSFMSVSISLMIALLFPVIAWGINQFRYKKHFQKHTTDKH